MVEKIKAILILLFFSSFLSSAQAFDPMLVRSADVNAFIEGQGFIQGSLPEGSEIELRILSFQETEFQQILSLSEELFIGEQTIQAERETDAFGNSIAVFRIRSLPAREFTYRIKARIKTDYYRFLQDFNLTQEIKETQEFLAPSQFIEAHDASIRTLAFNQFKTDSALELLRQATLWTHSYLEYDLNYALRTESALNTLKEKAGVCDEFANLEAALLRARGLPTRFVVGIVFSGKSWDNHAWLQAFIPGSGWVNVDPTYNEAGAIDGTHIILGVFEDASQAVDKATYPTTLALEIKQISRFQPGVDQSLVELNDKNNFQEFALISFDENHSLNANSFNDLNALVKNQSNSFQFVPLQLLLHEDFETEQDSALLLLPPFEKELFTFKTKPRLELEENTYATYSYKLSNPVKEISGFIDVHPFEEITAPWVELINLIPLIQVDSIDLEIQLKNHSLQEEKVLMRLGAQTFEEILQPRALKIITYSLPKELKKIDLSLQGSGLDFNESIQFYPEIPEKEKVEEIKEKPEEKIPPEKVMPEKPKPEKPPYEERMLLIGALALIFAILTILLLVKILKK